uniref:Tyrosine-protein phosphatase domain-containing protein n=1 Tax=Soboliphyme baturini TaxID=241478 RepID=A0A183IYD6_9BILA
LLFFIDDFNRVKLTSLSPGVSDYINASYVNGCFGKVAYIATQGPLECTAEDFWRMVIQCDVITVVMLCELLEDSKPKCFKYWPNMKEKKNFGGIRVSNVLLLVLYATVTHCFEVEEVNVKEHITTRQLVVRHDCGKREVHHFQYHGWPDHGSPEEIEPLLEFLEHVRVFQKEDDCRPIVVHCR